MDKKVIMFDDTETEKCEFCQHKSLILLSNIDINKLIASNKVSFGKKNVNIFMVVMMPRKLDLYAYFFQKWVHIIKLSVCLFW